MSRSTTIGAVTLFVLSVVWVLADASIAPPVSRIEVVLAGAYKDQVASIKQEFFQAGLVNVHVQFARQGQPPQNIGLGAQVPAERAREAIRLALKYNHDVAILLPERLFPPRFITIASSNFDDTVEYPIDKVSLTRLQDPTLTTEQFHDLYRSLTSADRPPVRKGRAY